MLLLLLSSRLPATCTLTTRTAHPNSVPTFRRSRNQTNTCAKIVVFHREEHMRGWGEGEVAHMGYGNVDVVFPVSFEMSVEAFWLSQTRGLQYDTGRRRDRLHPLDRPLIRWTVGTPWSSHKFDRTPSGMHQQATPPKCFDTNVQLCLLCSWRRCLCLRARKSKSLRQ